MAAYNSYLLEGKLHEEHLMKTWDEKIFPDAQAGRKQQARKAIGSLHGSVAAAAEDVALYAEDIASEMTGSGSYMPMQHTASVARITKASETLQALAETSDAKAIKEMVSAVKTLNSVLSLSRNLLRRLGTLADIVEAIEDRRNEAEAEKRRAQFAAKSER